MKTSYELAMERLAKQSPQAKLTAAQKAELADLESLYKSRIAELELGLKDRFAKAAAGEDPAEVDSVQQQFAADKRKLLAELEEKKERVRQGKRP
jgi:hypothetical protein